MTNTVLIVTINIITNDTLRGPLGLGWAGDPGVEGLGAPVLVLDELDTGVGGRLGQAVGRLLRRMSAAEGAAAGQLLCVSHLPQVRRRV